MRSLVLGLLAGISMAPCAWAQSNTIDGLDAKLNIIGGLFVHGRKGVFPNGVSGVSFDTNICNTGSVDIEWRRAMDPAHPVIAFMLGREYNGRFEQISDRSYVKHTFFATNASDCASCTSTGDSRLLSVGCSDTYGSAENGDRYWLAPPAEINPWLVSWEPVGSHFDQGEPIVAPPDDTDGVRSLTRAQVDAFGFVKHRVEARDYELNVTGANFYFWAEYLIAGEADLLREDSGGSRAFVPTWTGTAWTFSGSGSLLHGSILKNWTGATLDSNTNGADDGRVYIACVVTGPDALNNYHYEYAVHNRDNARAISTLRIPVCAGANISKSGFGDIDRDNTNQWTFSKGPAEAAWSTTANPLEWNTIYNFWFDCDAPPATGCRALVEEFRTGDGLDAFDIATTAPMGPALGTKASSGKPGGSGLVPDLALCGGLGVGETAEVMLRYAAPSSPGFFFVSDQNTGLAFHGGVILPYPPILIVPMTTDGAGMVYGPVAGVGGTFDLFVQFVVLDPAASGGVSMTDALEVVL